MSVSKRILIICPAKPGTKHGNRVTAIRWQRILRELGHCPQIADRVIGHHDVLIALHAFRSATAVEEFRARFPRRTIVVVITGTDLYQDGSRAATRRSMQLADRIVLLQAGSLVDLPSEVRNKVSVIYQSVAPLQFNRPRHPRTFRVVVAGHLRAVKDPFRAAMAVRHLPSESKIVVHHYGAAMNVSTHRRAREETKKNARYRWFGEVPRGRLRQHLARCWLMVLSSKAEGGANVLSEAMANHCPVIASRIAGSIGLLGKDYDGYFDVGDTAQLRALLLRCEQDADFHRHLKEQVIARSHLLSPEQERTAWDELIVSLMN